MSPHSGFLLWFQPQEQLIKNIYRINKGKLSRVLNTSWRRGLKIKQQNNFLFKVLRDEYRPIRISDFKSIYYQFKESQITKDFSHTILLQSDRIQSLFLKSGSFILNEMAFELNEIRAELGSYLNHISDAYTYQKERRSFDQFISDSAIHETKTRIKRFLFHKEPIIKNTIVAQNYQEALLFSLMIDEDNAYDLSLVHKTKKVDRDKKFRKVLVVSNTAGHHLKFVRDELEKWNEGVEGIAWRHIYGSLSRARIEQLLTKDTFDLIIYRGHARFINGTLHWVCDDGIFGLAPRQFRNYIHLGCADFADNKEIDQLPFSLGLMPVSVLPDQSYFYFIFNLLQNKDDLFRTFNEAKKSHLKMSSFFKLWHY